MLYPDNTNNEIARFFNGLKPVSIDNDGLKLRATKDIEKTLKPVSIDNDGLKLRATKDIEKTLKPVSIDNDGGNAYCINRSQL